MSERTRRVVCAEKPCREVGLFSYANARERDSIPSVWRCVRHSKPEIVLGIDNLERSVVSTVERGSGIISDKLFWRDAEGLGSGFTYGPGFRAFAQDFPEGTRLVVTARIEIPEEP